MQMNSVGLTSKTYDVDNFAAAQEFYHSNGWTDGLPVVPPTETAVEACLEWALMPPDQLIGIEPVREQPITAEKLAINAVMAGCLPMHFPVVATAWQAMMREEFLLHGVTSSTGGCASWSSSTGPMRAGCLPLYDKTLPFDDTPCPAPVQREVQDAGGNTSASTGQRRTGRQNAPGGLLIGISSFANRVRGFRLLVGWRM
jgi:hypothetical protein